MDAIDAGLVHDIGHDLATVSCLTWAARSDPHLEPETRRRLELIDREVGRVQDLLGLRCGLDAGPVAQTILLCDLVAEVTEPVTLGSSTRISVSAESDVRVRVDPRAAWRLLVNLVSNAVRAAGPGGHLQIAVIDDPRPMIRLTDDGPGMEHGPPGRAGLGLTICEAEARRCRAEVVLTARPEGGTSVTITFVPEGITTVGEDRVELACDGGGR